MKHICGTCRWYSSGEEVKPDVSWPTRLGEWPQWGICTMDGHQVWARYYAEETVWNKHQHYCRWERASDEEIAERALGL